MPLSMNAEALMRRAALVTRPSPFGDREPYLGLDPANGGTWLWGHAIRRQGIWLSPDHGNGGLLLYELPHDVDADALRGWLASPEVETLRTRLVAGTTREWNGREHVVRLSADASQASDQLGEAARHEVPTLDGDVSWWDAASWLYHDEEPDGVRRRYRVTTRTTDSQLEGIASAMQEQAAADHQIIDGHNLLAVLRTLRDEHPRRG